MCQKIKFLGGRARSVNPQLIIEFSKRIRNLDDINLGGEFWCII